MFYKELFLLGAFAAVCLSVDVDFNTLICTGQPAPANANLHCTTQSKSQEVHCKLTCNAGYDVTYLAARYYVCKADGKWSAVPPFADTKWPDCKTYGKNEPIP